MLHKKVAKLMGNRFEISVVDENEPFAMMLIDDAIAEIQRIEQVLTTFNEESETNQINSQAGISPVKVSSEVFHLIERSLKISEITQGAFDISYGSIDKSLWNFDLSMKKLPDAEIAKQAVRLINYQHIILDKTNSTVFLKEKGMRIGFGGIGKGYAADKAKQLLIQKGAKAGVVNASGDLTTWGTQPNGQAWTIGIANPSNKNQAFSSLNISNAAVATSGDYEKFVMIDGKRYSHTIDPKTGLPVSGIKSVTVITASAELADAMATPITVMGVQVGLNLINQMKNIACIIIDDQNRLYTSKNIHIK